MKFGQNLAEEARLSVALHCERTKSVIHHRIKKQQVQLEEKPYLLYRIQVVSFDLEHVRLPSLKSVRTVTELNFWSSSLLAEHSKKDICVSSRSANVTSYCCYSVYWEVGCFNDSSFEQLTG